MSMAIQRAKYTGDPGFFDFLKKAATIGTSFIPFVGPTISQAVSRLGSSGPGVGPVSRTGRTPAQERARCAAAGGQTWGGPGVGCVQSPLTGGATFFEKPGGFPPITFGGSRIAAEMNGMNGVMNMSGYHPNKSDYFLKSGEFVPAGTRMVKNRKRNPANARATSRAISRIAGAKTYAKSLGRISIRKKC